MSVQTDGMKTSGFEQMKTEYLARLGRPDRSKANLPDPQINPLLDAFNEHKDYYTTSSCAGRITLLELSPDKKKHEARWLYVTHAMAEADVAERALRGRTKRHGYEVWFKMESPILHVCARTLDAAQRLLVHCQQVGLKHAGITGTRRVMIEIFDNVRIDALMSMHGERLVGKRYLELSVDLANQKLSLVRSRMDELKKKIKK